MARVTLSLAVFHAQVFHMVNIRNSEVYNF